MWLIDATKKTDEGTTLMTLYQVNTITNHKNYLKILNLQPLNLILLIHSKLREQLVNSTKTLSENKVNGNFIIRMQQLQH